ncbi:hypothetical protein Dimus_019278 [Dionaea muscipula]
MWTMLSSSVDGGERWVSRVSDWWSSTWDVLPPRLAVEWAGGVGPWQWAKQLVIGGAVLSRSTTATGWLVAWGSSLVVLEAGRGEAG